MKYIKRIRTILTVCSLVISSLLGIAFSQFASAAVPDDQFAYPFKGYVFTTVAEHLKTENAKALDLTAGGTAPAVLASASGTVEIASTGSNTTCYDPNAKVFSNGFGNYVVIKHTNNKGTIYSMYAHLDSVAVKAGDAVIKSVTKLGVMGNTGCSFGAHTHFAIGSCLEGPAGAQGVAQKCSIWLGADVPLNTTFTTADAIPGSYPELGSVTPTPTPTPQATVGLKNGSFDQGWGPWTARGTTNYVVYKNGSIAGESARSGSYYAATNTSSGGSVSQDVNLTINAGDTICASAYLRSQGPGTGSAGTFALWMLGGTTEGSSRSASALGAGDKAWTEVQPCITATGAHTALRIEFYPTAGTLEIEDVDVHKN